MEKEDDDDDDEEDDDEDEDEEEEEEASDGDDALGVGMFTNSPPERRAYKLAAWELSVELEIACACCCNVKQAWSVSTCAPLNFRFEIRNQLVIKVEYDTKAKIYIKNVQQTTAINTTNIKTTFNDTTIGESNFSCWLFQIEVRTRVSILKTILRRKNTKKKRQKKTVGTFQGGSLQQLLFGALALVDGLAQAAHVQRLGEHAD